MRTCNMRILVQQNEDLSLRIQGNKTDPQGPPPARSASEHRNAFVGIAAASRSNPPISIRTPGYMLESFPQSHTRPQKGNVWIVSGHFFYVCRNNINLRGKSKRVKTADIAGEGIETHQNSFMRCPHPPTKRFPQLHTPLPLLLNVAFTSTTVCLFL